MQRRQVHSVPVVGMHLFEEETSPRRRAQQRCFLAWAQVWAEKIQPVGMLFSPDATKVFVAGSEIGDLIRAEVPTTTDYNPPGGGTPPPAPPPPAS